jgi:hypothetical protein
MSLCYLGTYIVSIVISILSGNIHCFDCYFYMYVFGNYCLYSIYMFDDAIVQVGVLKCEHFITNCFLFVYIFTGNPIRYCGTVRACASLNIFTVHKGGQKLEQRAFPSCAVLCANSNVTVPKLYKNYICINIIIKIFI